MLVSRDTCKELDLNPISLCTQVESDAMAEKSACELVVLVGQVGKVESWLYLSRNGMLGECAGRGVV